MAPTPDDLFWQNQPLQPPSLERVAQLRQAATGWTEQGNPLAAGLALSGITDAGWGLLPRDEQLEALRSAIAAFRGVTADPGAGFEALVALKKWAEVLMYLEYDGSDWHQRLLLDSDSIYAELAERLVSQFSDHPNAASFLVRGFRLCGPPTGPWAPEFPDGMVDDSRFDSDIQNRSLRFRIASAFQLFVRIGDYRAARDIGQRFPSEFTSPVLRGWHSAVLGLTDSDNPSDAFRKAAESFEGATIEHKDADRGWSSIHVELWAPYFRSRSFMAEAVREPGRCEAHISSAAACVPAHRSYSNTAVQRYHLFVRAIAGALQLKHGFDLTEARQELEREIRYFGSTAEDPAMLEFVEYAHTGLTQLRQDRRRGLTSVGRAMAALDRIPLFGGRAAEAVSVALDRRSLDIIEGPNRTWIPRTLETIRDETKLHRILLRLFQNSVPRYAQVLHGPLEFGKDVAVAVEEGGKLVLRMYQVKCGDINKGGWNKVRPQLEEIHQVPLNTLQISRPIDRRVGILVWNGHLDQHAEPVVQAWRNDQRAAFSREYEFMHLDDLVGYIIDNRLVNALRAALEEQGIPIA